jgi:hypothetical protein
MLSAISFLLRLICNNLVDFEVSFSPAVSSAHSIYYITYYSARKHCNVALMTHEPCNIVVSVAVINCLDAKHSS